VPAPQTLSVPIRVIADTSTVIVPIETEPVESRLKEATTLFEVPSTSLIEPSPTGANYGPTAKHSRLSRSA
jgi:hypothetical protein